jgi:two-component system response regulator PilR (NtrC family)
MKTARILIVEDEQDVREPLAEFLRTKGFEVETAEDGKQALEKLKEKPADLIVSDIQMPNMGGLELLKHVRSEYPAAQVIMFTAFGTVESAVDAIKSGAQDYVLKPVVFEDMQQKIDRILAQRDRGDIQQTRDRDGKHVFVESIIGESMEVVELRNLIKRVAKAESHALIIGESGTGKELVARSLHYESGRRDRPFVAINCAAIPEHLLESEFFGHSAGAFTGAAADKRGLFEFANKGTLFLDEVVELPVQMQAKLLRAIEEREITPLGRTKPIPVDLTIVSATAKDLKKEVEEGRFREELYFRLYVIEIKVPPLRDRRSDIPLLLEHFLRETNERIDSKVRSFSPAAKSALEHYRWPGNIRELRNIVERSVVMCSGDQIMPHDLPDDIISSSPELQQEEGFKAAVRGFERDLIKRTLAHCDNDKKQAAKLLGIGLSSLYRKLEEYGLS